MCGKALLETEKGREKAPAAHITIQGSHCSCELLGDRLCSLKSENRKRKDQSGGVGLAPCHAEKQRNLKWGFGLSPSHAERKRKKDDRVPPKQVPVHLRKWMVLSVRRSYQGRAAAPKHLSMSSASTVRRSYQGCAAAP